MKILYFIISFLFSINLTNLMEIDVSPNIFDNNFKINNFLIFQNDITGENYIAMLYRKRKTSESFIIICNSNGDLIFKKYLKKYRYHLFSEDNKLYFYSTYLYYYNIINNKLDSLFLA